MLRTLFCLTLFAMDLGLRGGAASLAPVLVAARLFHILARERVVLLIAVHLLRRNQRRAILAEDQKERILFDHRFRQPRLCIRGPGTDRAFSRWSSPRARPRPQERQRLRLERDWAAYVRAVHRRQHLSLCWQPHGGPPVLGMFLVHYRRAGQRRFR